jgi:hypothetical protein
MTVGNKSRQELQGPCSASAVRETAAVEVAVQVPLMIAVVVAVIVSIIVLLAGSG